MKKTKLYLASTSPRRYEILRLFQMDFCPIAPDFLEPTIKKSPDPGRFAISCALLKALSAIRRGKIKSGLVIGMDTIVVLKNKILQKPSCPEEASRMLKLLSNKTHYVITAIAIIKLPNKEVTTATESTAVKFRRLSEQEITEYIKTQEPYDKAGAYAIQGRAALFVEKVNGCYLNVIGLPLPLLLKLLNRLGCKLLRGN